MSPRLLCCLLLGCQFNSGGTATDDAAAAAADASSISDATSSDGVFDAAPSQDGAQGDAAIIDATAIDGASPDAAVPFPWEIAYVNRWSFNPENTNVFGDFASTILVNVGTSSLELSTLAVSNVSDDHPSATFGLSIFTSSSFALQPNDAGGYVAGDAATLLAPLVPESRVDLSFPAGAYLQLQFIDPGTGPFPYVVQAQADVTLEGATISLSFEITVSLTAPVGPKATEAIRL